MKVVLGKKVIMRTVKTEKQQGECRLNTVADALCSRMNIANFLSVFLLVIFEDYSEKNLYDKNGNQPMIGNQQIIGNEDGRHYPKRLVIQKDS